MTNSLNIFVQIKMAGTLSDVCYEHITDQYWYGLFGNFKLIIDRNTGFFNATKLCQEGGKQLGNWLRNLESKKLLIKHKNYVSQNSENNVFITIKGNRQNEKYNVIISGTYLPKELILSIGLWISTDFYYKVYKITESYFTNEYNETYRKDMCLLQERLQQIENENESYRHENERYRYENEQYQHQNEQYQHQNEQYQHQNERYLNEIQRYQTFEEDITFKTANAKKLHVFALIKKNCENSEYPFYVVRTQKGNYDINIKQLSKKYPDMEIIFELGYNPNSINLYNRIKERVENIKYHYNDIKLLNNLTQEEFIREIQFVADINIISDME